MDIQTLRETNRQETKVYKGGGGLEAFVKEHIRIAVSTTPQVTMTEKGGIDTTPGGKVWCEQTGSVCGNPVSTTWIGDVA